MATAYSKAAADDRDLEFRLRRSIEIAKEQKEMGKKKTTETTKERASVSRERRLALALRAVLDAIGVVSNDNEELASAAINAMAELDALSYSNLIGIPKRVAALNEQLKAAVDAGDGKEIARLGLALEAAKAGKAEKVIAPTAE